jgi:hypothetical protein
VHIRICDLLFEAVFIVAELLKVELLGDILAIELHV